MYKIKNAENIISPQLIYYKDYIDQNIDKAINIAHTSNRLWPHVKTHKMPQMVKALIAKGVTKFKCATIAECEMIVTTGATDVILAYPLIGPNIQRFIQLQKTFPKVNWYAIGDDFNQISKLNDAAVKADVKIKFMFDVNMGMNRTGVPISQLKQLAQQVKELKNIDVYGLHCYDGNHNNKDFTIRKHDVDATLQELHPVIEFINNLYGKKLMIIAGGTPAFPCYQNYENIFCSPGTLFVNDWGYEHNIPDLDFKPAACVFTRVVSHPQKNIFTVDCGYKAIASDPKVLRGHIVGFEDKVEELFQSEEHWVFKMKEGHENEIPAIGTELYIIQTHICPTTALYPFVLIADGEKGEIVDKWDVVARNRKITI